MEYVQRTQAEVLKADSRDSQEFHMLGRFVRQQWTQLSLASIASEQVLLQRAEPALRAITKQLCVPLNKSRKPPERPYYCLRLFEDQGIKVDILRLPAGGYIPSHDHPDTIGLQHVTHGTSWVIQADRPCPKRYRKRLLMTGETSFTFPDRNNIHGYYTDENEATLISINIQQKGKRPNSKHWHLSTHLISDVNDRLWRPVSYALMLMTLSTFPLLTSASECIMNQAQHELSRQNFQKAATLLKDCAEKGNEKAQRKLGDLYLTGRGVERDAYTAAQWYQKAARQGDVEAQYSYGIMLLDGNGITEDNMEGFDWIFEAARAGHNRAREVFDYIQANPTPLEC